MRVGFSGRRLLLAACVVVASIAAPQPATAHAASLAPSCSALNGSPASSTTTVSPSAGNPFILCAYTGANRVHSFDGTPLRIDLSLPITSYIPPGSSTAAKSPLVIFQSGYSNDYCEFESATLAGSSASGCSDFIGNAGYDWNNTWFASKGFATINFTPRGWYESCGRVLSTHYGYATDPECQSSATYPTEKSWVHLLDRRYEVHDAQFLAGTVADALLPNGTSTDGFNGAPSPSTFNHDTPIGVEKMSYVGGLFAKGYSNVPSQAPDGAQHAAPSTDPTADLNKWFTEINAGEPTFAANPDTPTILAEVGGPLRSPIAMAIPNDNGLAPTLNTQKPIFVMQGLTDPLFPGLQATTMINHLQAAHSHHPVWAFLGDIGHSYANNPLDVWQQAHNLSNAFVTAALQATSLAQVSQLFTQPTITMDTTRCLPSQTLQTFTAASFGSIATTNLNLADAGAAQVTFNPSAGGPEGAHADPIVTSTCVTLPTSQTDANEATYNFAIPNPVTLVGGPVVSVSATLIGASAELAARLWDVDPGGNQTLITRGVFRLDEPLGSTTIPLKFQLWPNAWQICSGDSLKLELTQTDAPTFRPDNESSAISLSGLHLSLPVVPGAACQAPVTTAESPFTPALPLLPLGAIAAVAVYRRRHARAGA